MSRNSLQNIDIRAFQTDLLDWYQINKRDLPWRRTSDPYKIWISEVMLQQTQVKTVIPYFERFMEKFPTVYDLAAADEQLVLKEWEGLGYYSRARNLHTAAKEVATAHDGKVPTDPKTLGQLIGIGPYTKGAILSIAFNERHPAVDGNVMRVYSRLLNISNDITRYQTRNLFAEYVYETIPEKNPGDFNQGIMELGALICTPKQPKCEQCPVSVHCQAYEFGLQSKLPVRNKQTKQREIAYVALLIVTNDGQVIIEQRPSDGLLANLWQFPMVPVEEIGFSHIEQYMFAEYGLKIKLREKKGTLRHVFSHLIWHLSIYEATLENTLKEEPRLQQVNIADLTSYPFSTSHIKMMELL